MANRVGSFGLKRDFQNLFKKGCHLKKQGIIIYGIKNENLGLRLAYGVSKKNIRRAVQRNKIKRWGRACLRENTKLEEQNLDFLIIVKEDIKNYADFKKNVDELVDQMLQRQFKKSPSSFH